MGICIDEFVRTEFGNIGKFYRPASESSDVYYIYIDKDGNKISSRYDSIVKHSKNIIDLIEVGDYVNGSKVIDIARGKKKAIYVEQVSAGALTPILEKDIKSILTHEQFSSLEYII
jgi:hypothetical protein